MMESFLSSSNDSKGAFDVVLNGGSPWGFTLQGGSEFRSKLVVSKVTPGGKADRSHALVVGDEVLTVNGIECSSRAEAIELVRCARDTLRLKIRRRNGDTVHLNGQVETRQIPSEPLPNLYATARELAESSDFYSTYNVDPDQYKRMTQQRPFSYHAHTKSDSLSGSSEDLLESYRKDALRQKSAQRMSQQNNPRLSKSSTDISNSRGSPLAVDMLRKYKSMTRINDRHLYPKSTFLYSKTGRERTRSWSDRRGTSLQEPPVSPNEGQLSPGRIMKVTVRTTTITGPSGASGTNPTPSGLVKGVERDRLTQSLPRQTTEPVLQRNVEFQDKKRQDNWFERWLRDGHREKVPPDSRDAFQQNFAAARSRFEQTNTFEERTTSMAELNLTRQSHGESNALLRSKSFSGRPIYGVRETEGSLFPDHNFSQAAAPAPPKRFSSSALLHDKNFLPLDSDSRHNSSASVPADVRVSSFPGQAVDLKLHRDLTQRLSGSTSSLDSVGTMDSNVSRSRQGPAPPPRRSTSKLLSSFRSKDKNFAARYLAGMQSAGYSLDKPSQESTLPRSNEPELLVEPKHAASKSWPTQSAPEQVSGGDVIRQSWHAEPAQSRPRRPQRYSYQPQGSDRNYNMGQTYSSSVRIRAVSTGARPHPKIYRSASQEGSFSGEHRKWQGSAYSEGQPRKFSMSLDRRTSQDMQPGRIHVEDTQILKHFINDALLPERMENKRPTVKSRVATFESQSEYPVDQEPGVHGRSKSFSHNENTARKAPAAGLRHASSTENLLEEKRSPQETVRHDQRWASTRQDFNKEQRWHSPPEVERKQIWSPPRKIGTVGAEKESFQHYPGEMAKGEAQLPTAEDKRENLSTSPFRDSRNYSDYFRNSFKREEKTPLVGNRTAQKGRHSVGSFRSGDYDTYIHQKRQFEPRNEIEVAVQPLITQTSSPRHRHSTSGFSSQPREDIAADSSVNVEPGNKQDSVYSFVQESSTTHKSLQSNLQRPVSEEVVMKSSLVQVEQELDLERRLYELDSKEEKEPTVYKEKDTSVALDISLPPPPPPVVNEEEILWDNDESLPPPPPEMVLDTSQDNLPLPSPPGDVLSKHYKQEFEFSSLEGSSNYNGTRENVSLNEFSTKDNRGNDLDVFQENKKNSKFSLEKKFEVSVNSRLEQENPTTTAASLESEPKNSFEQGKSISVNDSSKQGNVLVESSSSRLGGGDAYSSSPSEYSRHSTDLDSSPDERHRHHSDTAHQGMDKSSPPSPLIITSTPTKEKEKESALETGDQSSEVNSPFSLGSDISTPSSSRPNSMMSPKLEQLDKEKTELVDSMKRKINELRSQQEEIADEIKANEELGEKITKVVESYTTRPEFSKYQLFTGELNKIIGLLLSLTQRMHRYELMLQDLDMSEESDRIQRDVLLEKIEKVKSQYEEACMIKEVNDKRGEVVSKFLEQYCTEEQFADFQYYIDMKTQLALMHAEIRDKVKMGNERLSALSQTAIDWSVMSLS